ncbi:cholesterol transport system auxiliary component [Halopseudomonas xinjiangensis]|uniref:Cholesterol transport system auxiliary component n=1 Tax=Halopseudomonas xinjiangensis TaxID=487184 RepID=A0A1H1LL33_9GAMM|nr:ABC-type transport auxiliary lipoprotein family protein [Halopseudomonas xinjiangensis]SDR75264.1 cholesterol transport system auxiliary component [Halopseudomonas xinjiangensis]
MIALPRLRSLGLIAGIAWLAACSVIPETEPVTVYQLPAPSVSQVEGQPAPVSLRINTPHAGIAVSGPRMLVNPEGDQISAYKGVRWSDPAPAMLREHLTRAFNLSGAMQQVSNDDHALHADYFLSSDLRRFQVSYIGGPTRAIIELDARLVDPSNRRMLANRTFLVEEVLEDTEVPAVVRAFGRATARLEAELIPWAREQLLEASEAR